MENEFAKNFSKNLRDLIQKDGRSPSTLAKLVGVNKSTVHNWCNGVVPSGLDGVEKLARFFNKSVAEIVGEPALDLKIKISGDPQGIYCLKIEKELESVWSLGPVDLENS